MKNFSLSFFSRKLLYPSVILLILMTLLTGLAYPLLITGIAQTVFPDKANGSLIGQDGKFVGSRLIGQNFPNRVISGAGLLPLHRVLTTLRHPAVPTLVRQTPS